MNAPAQAPAPITPTAPQVRPAPAAARTADATNAAAAAIARAEALAAARPAQAVACKPQATPAPTPAAPLVSTPAPASAKAAKLHPWRTFFTEWPSQIPKRGILISKLNEASPFKAFMLRGDFLLLERTSPDSLGGRYLVVPFEEISVVKFTDPLTQPALEAAGFQGKLSL